MLRRTIVRLLFAFALLPVASARANLKLPSFFSDHMVVQRDKPVVVWGWAGENARVTATFAGAKAAATADAEGRWKLSLPACKAGGPHKLIVGDGAQTVTIDDVLVGDVWICSGQSNMAFPVSRSGDTADAAKTDLPLLRAFATTAQPAPKPQDDLPGSWSAATTPAVTNWYATAFYFGRKLQKELGVPVGLLMVAWGGTPAEAWLPRGDLEKLPFTAQFIKDSDTYAERYPDILKRFEEQKARLKEKGDTEALRKLRTPHEPKSNPSLASVQYNNRIAPFVGFPVRGAIWYQGEANASGVRATQYGDLMAGLIRSWRGLWRDEFPFGVVQLTAYKAAQTEPVEGGSGWAALREQQVKIARTVPKTGVAVIIDHGEADDIHPKSKTAVGERLAAWALNEAYGRKDVVPCGPLYKGMRKEGGAIRISFDHAQGLRAEGGAVKSLAIAGADKVFKAATGRIEGTGLVVSSPDVADPVAVRYGWADNPPCNLVNGAGLAASPFRTDDWPLDEVVNPKPVRK
jgi:sialate O-acetylesterase